MIKKDIIELVAHDVEGLTKRQIEAVIDGALEQIAIALEKGDEVKLAGFGNFVVKTRAAREGVNPSNGEKIKIAASKVPGFKPSKNLKERVK